MGKRRYCSEEFKRAALELSLNSYKTIKAVAENLGTSPYNLSRWRREYSEKGDLSFHGKNKHKLTPEQEEVQTFCVGTI